MICEGLDHYDVRESLNFLLRIQVKMSALEVVGIPLAILPLIITAAEDYDKIYRRFKRFKRFAAEAKDFLSRLQIQRTIFREECRHLLALVLGIDEARMFLFSRLRTMLMVDVLGLCHDERSLSLLLARPEFEQGSRQAVGRVQ